MRFVVIRLERSLSVMEMPHGPDLSNFPRGMGARVPGSRAPCR